MRSDSDGCTTAKSYCPQVSGLRFAAKKSTRIDLEVDIDRSHFEQHKLGSFIRNDFAESDDDIEKSAVTTDEFESKGNQSGDYLINVVPLARERSPPGATSSQKKQHSPENKKLFTFSK